jgi:hypothetical protein
MSNSLRKVERETPLHIILLSDSLNTHITYKRGTQILIKIDIKKSHNNNSNEKQIKNTKEIFVHYLLDTLK